MRLKNIFLFVFVVILSLQICFGQNTEEAKPTENWLLEYNIYSVPFLSYRYDRYSKEDVTKFREKLDLFKNAKYSDEWEGVYFAGHEETVGFSQLQIDSNIGFTNLYIYSCLPELRYINYGGIINTPDYIHLSPEFVEKSLRKSQPVTYIKVKWGDRHYLVEESSLTAFAEKAVGIYIDSEDESIENRQKWANCWVKGDLEKDLTGLPEFPANYKQFQRLPIETKIISVRKRTIETEAELDNIFYSGETAVYKVTIGAGKDKGVKRGMHFDIPEISDEIFITEVKQNISTGIVIRTINDNKNDLCYDENSKETSCPKIKSSLKVKTRIGDFLF